MQFFTYIQIVIASQSAEHVMSISLDLYQPRDGMEAATLYATFGEFGFRVEGETESRELSVFLSFS